MTHVSTPSDLLSKAILGESGGIPPKNMTRTSSAPSPGTCSAAAGTAPSPPAAPPPTPRARSPAAPLLGPRAAPPPAPGQSTPRRPTAPEASERPSSPCGSRGRVSLCSKQKWDMWEKGWPTLGEVVDLSMSKAIPRCVRFKHQIVKRKLILRGRCWHLPRETEIAMRKLSSLFVLVGPSAQLTWQAQALGSDAAQQHTIILRVLP